MTRHRMFNVALFTLALIAWLFVMDSDYHAEQDMEAERREWAEAVAFCHRYLGPQSGPEYDLDDRLVCVTRRGERHAAIR